MKSSPLLPLSRDLSERPEDRPGDRLNRVANLAPVVCAGKPHGTPTHVVAAELQDPSEEDVARVTAMRESAYAKLAPRGKVAPVEEEEPKSIGFNGSMSLKPRKSPSNGAKRKR